MPVDNVDPNRVPDFSCALQLAAGKYRSRFPLEPADPVVSLRPDLLKDKLLPFMKFDD